MAEKLTTQYGAVLVFKADVSREDAERAIRQISHWLDESYYYGGGPPKVYSFHPEHGGPVWYIP